MSHLSLFSLLVGAQFWWIIRNCWFIMFTAYILFIIKLQPLLPGTLLGTLPGNWWWLKIPYFNIPENRPPVGQMRKKIYSTCGVEDAVTYKNTPHVQISLMWISVMCGSQLCREVRIPSHIDLNMPKRATKVKFLSPWWKSTEYHLLTLWIFSLWTFYRDIRDFFLCKCTYARISKWFYLDRRSLVSTTQVSAWTSQNYS